MHRTVTAALAALLGTVAALADTPGKTQVIAVDLSPQNRALTDPDFNSTVGTMLAAYLARQDLQFGDTAIMRAFGPPGGNPRPVAGWNSTINFAYQKFGGKDPRQLAPYLAQNLKALLDVAPTGQTDLHWSLARLAQEIDCKGAETHLLLIANLVEAGRFEGGGYALAPLAPDAFAGCASVTVAGFDGAFISGSAAALTVAEQAWTETLQEAGFDHVEFLR
jgi:hypothetical protein